MAEKLLLTMDEGAALLSVGRSTMYILVLRGDIRSVKLGKSRRVPLAEIEKYVERLVQQSARGAA